MNRAKKTVSRYDARSGDLFLPLPVAVAVNNPESFTPEFLDYLPENMHVYEAFEGEARKIIARGIKHYSARTILHALRHHSAIHETGSPWKLNNDVSPYLARLFAMLHPAHAKLFEFREAKAPKAHRAKKAADKLLEAA